MYSGYSVDHGRRRSILVAICCFISVFSLIKGYSIAQESESPVVLRCRVYKLKYIPAQEAREFLTELKIGTDINPLPHNTLIVTSGGEKASNLISLIDSETKFAIKTVPYTKGPAPTIEQINAELGDIVIGTFEEPPQKSTKSLAIVDQEDSGFVVIAPVEVIDRITTAIYKLQPKPQEQSEPAPELEPEPEPAPEPEPEPQPEPNEVVAAEINEPNAPCAEKVHEDLSKPQPDKSDVEQETDAEAVHGEAAEQSVAKEEQAEVSAQPGGQAELVVAEPVKEKPVEETMTTTPPVVKEEPPAEQEEPVQVPRPQLTKEPEPMQPQPAVEEEKPTEEIAEAVVEEKPVKLQPAVESEPVIEEKPTEETVEAVVEEKPTEETVEAVVEEKATAEPAETIPKSYLDSLAIPDAEKELELTLTLPEKVEILALLELVGKQLGLNYIYDAGTVKGEVMLKVHAGRIKIKDTYALLESVLRFKDLAMVRKGNLVTIVPIAKAAEQDPTFYHRSEDIKPGDVVVTSLFVLKHISTETAEKFLKEMKLSIDIKRIDESNTLIVTGFAYRIERIEQVLKMIDLPGKEHQFKFRTLKYTAASKLLNKLNTLTKQLGTVSLTIAPAGPEPKPEPTKKRPSRTAARSQKPAPTPAAKPIGEKEVYIDLDDRTNRILMIGLPEQVAIVDKLIDDLDVKQHGIQYVAEYVIKHVDSVEIINALDTLGLAKEVSSEKGVAATDQPQIYVQEATNTLLVNATAEQHAAVTLVINHVDVKVKDPRTIVEYEVQFVDTSEIINTLTEFGIIGNVASTTSKSESSKADKSSPEKPGSKKPTTRPVAASRSAGAEKLGRIIGGPLAEPPQVAIMESKNSLLINASAAQHRAIALVMAYVDVEHKDLRTIIEYEIQYVGTEEIIETLDELGVTVAAEKPTRSTTSRSKPTSAAAKASNAESSRASGSSETTSAEGPLSEPPQIAVLESTNSLLVNATAVQHARIALIIAYVDRELEGSATPYIIYALENQEPEELASVLDQLIKETVEEKSTEGKIQTKSVAFKDEDRITIVPDPISYSLIVYANKKNQQWVSTLIEELDQYRPQVLLNCTLVEILKNDDFTSDIELLTSLPDLTNTSGLVGVGSIGSGVIDSLTAAPDRSSFIDFSSISGTGNGFYGDKKVQALITLVQKKGYGRVLARPKLLVDDNREGFIETKSTTYITRTSSTTQIPDQGSAIITDQDEFDPYDASIKLIIKPHISKGNNLRLEIELVRSDFVNFDDTSDEPPDKSESSINTVVTVPDGSTIILGGMDKINQSKGGEKVPLLGDIPLLGGLFRKTANKSSQSNLYIFVKAHILRPGTDMTGQELINISRKNRIEFEKTETEMQEYENWPGLKPDIMEPEHILEKDVLEPVGTEADSAVGVKDLEKDQEQL